MSEREELLDIAECFENIVCLNEGDVGDVMRMARALKALLQAKAPNAEQGLMGAVDAAMAEMENISPPLRRSECERLIRAALLTQPHSKRAMAAARRRSVQRHESGEHTMTTPSRERYTLVLENIDYDSAKRMVEDFYGAVVWSEGVSYPTGEVRALLTQPHSKSEYKRIAAQSQEGEAAEMGTPETDALIAELEPTADAETWCNRLQHHARQLERELHEKRMELVGANASIRQLNQMLEWKDNELKVAYANLAEMEHHAEEYECAMKCEGEAADGFVSIRREVLQRFVNDWMSIDAFADLEANTDDLNEVNAAIATPPQSGMRGEWQPIETAPKTGKTLLLGYRNELGKWRTLRGQWVTQTEIDSWDSEDSVEGWYETSVEAEDPSSCWPTAPTHWMNLPEPPDAN